MYAVPSTVDHMASVMREMAFGGQTVTAEALALKGDFSKAEIERYGQDAADKARADSIRQRHDTDRLAGEVRLDAIVRAGVAYVGQDARGLPRYRIRSGRVPA